MSRVFTSYSPEQVEFLLEKFTGHLLSVKEKEAMLQSGNAYYGDILSKEDRPDPYYTKIFDNVLENTKDLVAKYFIALAEKIISKRDVSKEIVLVSLARAGTPVGVVLKEVLTKKYGLQVKHYSVSAIHKYGVDAFALKYILERHAPETLTFLDGWVSQGRITRTLVDTLKDKPEIDSALYCISDPSGIQNAVATREDILLPSAILNATVSGLVSRTVNNPHGFHFVASYQNQLDLDRSLVFVDEIVKSCMNNTFDFSDHSVLSFEKQRPLALQQIADFCEEFNTVEANIKIGLGEVSRSLLRRVPKLVLVNEKFPEQTEHMFWMAKQRDIEIVSTNMTGPFNAFSILK